MLLVTPVAGTVLLAGSPLVADGVPPVVIAELDVGAGASWIGDFGRVLNSIANVF